MTTPPPPPSGPSAGAPGDSPSNPPTAPGYGPPPGYPQQAPPKKGRSKALIGLLACGGLFVALIVVGAIVAAVAPKSTTTTGATSSAGAGPAAPSPAADSGPGASKDHPAPLGTAVTAAKGWTIKVTAASLDGDAELAKENPYYKPDAGKQFVIVDLTTTNGIGRPDMLAANVKLSLLTPAGVAVQQSFFPTPPNALDVNAQLQPGATVSGRIAFQVPQADVPNVVLLAEPVFTLDQNGDQRFLALK